MTVQLPSGPRTKPYWFLATSGLLKIAGWSAGLIPARLHGTTLPPCGPPPCCARAGAPVNESTATSAIAQPNIIDKRIMSASTRLAGRLTTLECPSNLVGWRCEHLPKRDNPPTDMTRVILYLWAIRNVTNESHIVHVGNMKCDNYKMPRACGFALGPRFSSRSPVSPITPE